jgi:hypothetical protein
MAVKTEPDFGEYTATLKAAQPENWYLSDLAFEQAWDQRPGYPSRTFSITASTGRVVGTRPRYYVGGQAETSVGRRVEVRLQAASIDALADAVRLLPKLEFIFVLPVDTEVSVSTYDL